MTVEDIKTVASNAGFSGDDLTTAVAVALAESGGNPNSLGDIGIGEGSFGLWQISSKYHPEYGPDFSTLYDPQTNADAAFAVYSAAGNSFTPWTTFKTGAYQSFLNTAAAAVAVFVTQNPVAAGSAGGGLILIVLLAFFLLRKR